MHMRRFQCSERGIKIEVAGGVSGVGGLLCRGRIAPKLIGSRPSTHADRARRDAVARLHAH